MTQAQAGWIVSLLFMLFVMLCWACSLLEKIHKTLNERREEERWDERRRNA